MKNSKFKTKNPAFYTAILIFSFFIFHFNCFAADQLTITTYYPSPYGVYKVLRVYPNTDCAVGGACNKGEICYNSTSDQFLMCGSTSLWAAMGGGGGYWTQTGSVLYATDTAWSVGIGTTSPEFKLSLDSDGGIIAKGTYSSGATLPAIAQGSILIWYPRKAAFRAGYAGVGSWSDAMIGVWSTAMGYDTVASTDAATAMGMGTTASGYASTAMGDNTIASSFASTAMGYSTTASGPYSTAMGRSTTASGTNSIALGLGVGANTLLNNIDDSLMIGFNSNIPTLFVGPSLGVGTTGNVGIGTASPGGGTSSNILSIANKAAAAPTAAAGMTHLYTSSGEGYWMDQSGNVTLQTPHDPETGEWIFFSKNIKTGRVVRINMEQLIKAVEEVTGKKFMFESQEQQGADLEPREVK